MALFGPGLTALWIWLTWGPAPRDLPWPIDGVVVSAALAAWWFLLRSLVFEHRAELLLSRRQLRLVRRRGGPPVLTLDAGEVVGLRRDVAWYRPDDGPAVANQVLQIVVSARGGETCILSLCASPDAALIEAFEAQLAIVLEAEVQHDRSE